MSFSPRSPRVVRGAVIGFDIFNPIASVIVFQYNPDKLTRTLTPQGVSGQAARADVLRLSGAPVEKIDLDVDIDAADQLEAGEGVASRMGIYPQLSALEMLLYPKSLGLIINSLLVAGGSYPAWGLAATLLASLVLAIPLTGALSRTLARIAPRSTTAVSFEQLVGRVGTVASTSVSTTYGRVAVRDSHGTIHTVYAVIESGGPLPEQSEVALLRYDQAQRRFVVAALGSVRRRRPA